MSKIKILILCASILFFEETEAVCRINVFAQNIIRPGKCYVPEPLVLDSFNEFKYPTTNRFIEFADGEKIQIRCPGSSLKDGGVTLPDGEYECRGPHNSQAVFRSPRNSLHYFQNVRCEYLNYNDAANAIRARPSRNRCHGGTLDRVDIGYDFQQRPLISVCFDTPNNRPLYSKFVLTKDISNGGLTHRLPFFYNNSGVYNKMSVDNLYYFGQEKTSLRNLLPSEVPNFSRDYSWNRGHLTANADFVFRFQRYTTFEYSNVAPQWSEFNSGNWNELENAVRETIAGGNTDATVYTGVFDTITVLRYGVPQPLVLESNDRNTRIPIPKWFWKHVKTPQLQNYVFFGWNYPFTTKEDANNEFEKICGPKKKEIETVLPINVGYPIGPNVVVTTADECLASGSGLLPPRIDPNLGVKPFYKHDELRDPEYVPDDLHKGLLYVCDIASIRKDTVEGTKFKSIISNLIN